MAEIGRLQDDSGQKPVQGRRDVRPGASFRQVLAGSSRLLPSASGRVYCVVTVVVGPVSFRPGAFFLTSLSMPKTFM